MFKSLALCLSVLVAAATTATAQTHDSQAHVNASPTGAASDASPGGSRDIDDDSEPSPRLVPQDETEQAALSQEPAGEVRLSSQPDSSSKTAPVARAAAKDEHRDDDNGKKVDDSFRWRPALAQSLLFLGVQHGYAMTQPKTRRDLKGEFFPDYFRSVRSLRKWDDGGRFFTNYIAHPMQGSLTGFIQVHNDPKGAKQRFGGSKDYWKSRMKAIAWSAAWSTQFEIGPVSQASIGNVGLHGKQTYVDLVMTPTAGTGLLVVEDALDRYVIERIERGTGNFYVKIGSRMVLNPTRTLANVLRFKKPWYRDAGLR